MTLRAFHVDLSQALGVVAASLLLASCSSNPCSLGGPTVSPGQLAAGEYEVVMRATRGPNAGQSTRGTLHLVASKASDRSPETGRGPWAVGSIEYPFYGWMEMDFDAIGAPILAGEGNSPMSKDPIDPGVLAQAPIEEGGAPVLLVGTEGQTRNSSLPAEDGAIDDGSVRFVISTDGSGIGLSVHRSGPGGFKGQWKEWGIVRGGRGTFCARSVSGSP